MLAVLDQPDAELAIPQAVYEALNALKMLFSDPKNRLSSRITL